MKFRPQRATLAEAMDEVCEVSDMADLKANICRIYDWLPNLDDLVVKPYGLMDARIGWDTYIVHSPKHGVMGFTNRPL